MLGILSYKLRAFLSYIIVVLPILPPVMFNTAALTRSRKRWYFCTASGGTSKNLELKGKFLEYLRQLSWRKGVKKPQDPKQHVNQNITWTFSLMKSYHAAKLELDIYWNIGFMFRKMSFYYMDCPPLRAVWITVFIFSRVSFNIKWLRIKPAGE